MAEKQGTLQSDAEFIFKEALNDNPEWYNAEGRLHHYLTSEQFNESNAVRKTQAKRYVADKLKNPPNDFWKQKREELEGPFLSMMAGDAEEIDKMVSKDHNLYDFLLKQTSPLLKELYTFADLLLSEPTANVYPVATIDLLIDIREKVYQKQLSIYIKKRKANEKDISWFRTGWLVTEQENAERIREAIKADKIISSKKIAHTGTMRRYVEYIEGQLANKGEIPKTDLNTDEPEKPSYLGYALLHHYWYKHTKDAGVQINERSYKRWAKEHQLSPKQLWKYAKPMLEEEPRSNSHHNSKLEFGRQYRLILPLLKTRCEPAFNEVEAILERLKRSNPALVI